MTTETRFARVTRPVTDLVLLNAETTGTVLSRQNALVADMISASVDQVRVLTEAGSLRDAVEAQRAFIRELGEKLQSTARENVETIRGAGREAGQVVRGAFRKVEDQVSETIEEVRVEAAVAVEDAASSVSEVISGTSNTTDFAPQA